VQPELSPHPDISSRRQIISWMGSTAPSSVLATTPTTARELGWANPTRTAWLPVRIRVLLFRDRDRDRERHVQGSPVIVT